MCNGFEGSLHGKFCSGMLVSGLSKLGRNVLISVGSCVISAHVVIAAWYGVKVLLCFWSAGDVCSNLPVSSFLIVLLMMLMIVLPCVSRGGQGAL